MHRSKTALNLLQRLDRLRTASSGSLITRQMQMVSTAQAAHSRLLWSGCSHQAPVRHFSTEKDTARVEEPTENEKKLTVEVEELR
ncbi:AGAP012865-PA, partial [Anopheles gambiae str. PEST]